MVFSIEPKKNLSQHKKHFAIHWSYCINCLSVMSIMMNANMCFCPVDEKFFCTKGQVFESASIDVWYICVPLY